MKSGSTRRALDPAYVPGSNPGGSSIIERGEELIIHTILGIIFGIVYCEFMWVWRTIEVIKPSFKFMIGLNFIISIMFSSSGNLALAIVILLYYLVIIDYRFKKN